MRNDFRDVGQLQKQFVEPPEKCQPLVLQAFVIDHHEDVGEEPIDRRAEARRDPERLIILPRGHRGPDRRGAAFVVRQQRRLGRLGQPVEAGQGEPS